MSDLTCRWCGKPERNSPLWSAFLAMCGPCDSSYNSLLDHYESVMPGLRWGARMVWPPRDSRFGAQSRLIARPR